MYWALWTPFRDYFPDILTEITFTPRLNKSWESSFSRGVLHAHTRSGWRHFKSFAQGSSCASEQRRVPCNEIVRFWTNLTWWSHHRNCWPYPFPDLMAGLAASSSSAPEPPSPYLRRRHSPSRRPKPRRTSRIRVADPLPPVKFNGRLWLCTTSRRITNIVHTKGCRVASHNESDVCTGIQ